VIAKKYFYVGRTRRSDDEACREHSAGIGMQAIAGPWRSVRRPASIAIVCRRLAHDPVGSAQ